ncbi:MAG: hypothetical protein AAFO79_06150 [Pseudomonadota bacterium]
MSPEIELHQKVARAAVTLAADHDWPDVTLADLAREAGVTLSDLRRYRVATTATALKSYFRVIDEEVMARAHAEVDAQDPARDRLFDVVMMRFDAMAPDRAGLARIIRTSPFIPELTQPLLNAQRWMLAAAQIDIDGGLGMARTFGLARIYGEVFKVWLDDDTGNTQTMALLDRRLRSAEKNLRNVERFGAIFQGLAARGGRRRQRSKTGDDGAPDAGSGAQNDGPSSSFQPGDDPAAPDQMSI